MVIQYPHILRFKVLESTPVLVGGEWVFQDGETKEYECRGEVASQGKAIKTASGDLVPYSFIIYTKPLSETVEYGTEIELVISENETHKSKVLCCVNGQLNTKIWI